MGCDIHFYVEERVGGLWKSVDTWKPDEHSPQRLRVDWDKQFYEDRNYALFSILANVRNGYGFAGVRTGDGFTTIAPPRGLPDDASQRVKDESDAYGGDGHSHSWLTAREILDFDWNQKTMLAGVVDANEFQQWKAHGQPRSYCGSVSGPKIRYVEPAEMEAAIARAGAHKDPSLLDGLRCQVEWSRYYYEVAGTFPLAVFRCLHKAAPEDVRFVFWFDN